MVVISLEKHYMNVIIAIQTKWCTVVYKGLRPSRSDCLFLVSQVSIPNAGQPVGAKVSGNLKIRL